MNKIFTYIFYHSKYKYIQKLFESCINEHRNAYELWAKKNSFVTSNSWTHKKIVAKNFNNILMIERCVYYEQKYPNAWKYYTQEKCTEEISMENLSTYVSIKEEVFQDLEQSIIITNRLFSGGITGLKYFLKEQADVNNSKLIEEAYLLVLDTERKIDLKKREKAIYFNRLVHIPGPPIFKEEVYYLIAREQKKIIAIDKTIETASQVYNDIPKVWMFLAGGRPPSNMSINEINEIPSFSFSCFPVRFFKYLMGLEVALHMSEKYPRVWKLFSIDKKDLHLEETILNFFNVLHIERGERHIKSAQVKKILRNAEVKEQFLSATEGKEGLVKLMIGSQEYIKDSFSDSAFQIESYVLKELKRDTRTHLFKPHESILQNNDELKQVILDYKGYGSEVKFSEDFSIQEFYKYRNDIDAIGHRFSELAKRVKENKEAIVAYNAERGNGKATFISDYILMGDEDSEMHKYVARYKQTTLLRSEVKNIKQNYPLGFQRLIGDINIDIISLTQMNDILSQKQAIKIEEEKQQKEREKAKQKKQIQDLKDCTSSSLWYEPRATSVKCFSLFYYYPTTCEWEADSKEWEIRRLIWDFKANPNKPTTLGEIIKLHESATEKILPNLIHSLKFFFGSQLNLLTLVCIPASKKEITERRYKNFSDKLSIETCMKNGYKYIHVVKDGGAKHLGQSSDTEYELDENFFRDKYVLLFDDIITSGSSMQKMKIKLEDLGATVIGGISVGITTHNRKDCNPIDRI